MFDVKYQIKQALNHALENKGLDPSLTPAILPALAEALEPHLAKFVAKHGSFPDKQTFCMMVNNFNYDGPLVNMLSPPDQVGAVARWAVLQQNLLCKTQRDYPNLDAFDQDEIVAATLRRVQSGLPEFMFRARLSTWIHTIWRHESYRWLKKMKKKEEKECPLSESESASPNPSEACRLSKIRPEWRTERDETIADFWRRVEALNNQVDVKILRLHLAGFKLGEIKQSLGENAPSIPTIKRRKDRVIERLKTDCFMQEIAARLEI